MTTTMTTLDHSSPTTLVRDMNLHQGGLFRFERSDGSNPRPAWRLVSAAVTDAAGNNLCFLAEHSSGMAECISWFNWGLRRLHIVGMAGVWVVVLMIPTIKPLPCDSADGSQSDQLDKNLRGIFA